MERNCGPRFTSAEVVTQRWIRRRSNGSRRSKATTTTSLVKLQVYLRVLGASALPKASYGSSEHMASRLARSTCRLGRLSSFQREDNVKTGGVSLIPALHLMATIFGLHGIGPDTT